MVITAVKPLVAPDREKPVEMPQMVMPAAKPFVVPEHKRPAEEPQKVPCAIASSQGTTCPRCGTKLTVNYHEPQCLPCGYVDYHFVPPTSDTASKSIISTATRDILRYVGDFSSLNDTLTYVRLRRVRNRVVYDVTCPFCDGAMEQSSLSGKRREIREERYKCADGHRVSLTPTKTGSLGWK